MRENNPSRSLGTVPPSFQGMKGNPDDWGKILESIGNAVGSVVAGIIPGGGLVMQGVQLVEKALTPPPSLPSSYQGNPLPGAGTGGAAPGAGPRLGQGPDPTPALPAAMPGGAAPLQSAAQVATAHHLAPHHRVRKAAKPRKTRRRRSY